MSFTTSKTAISTAVCVAAIDSVFDINSIFNNIIIDDTILGIKYHNKIRGEIKNTGSFFNQATIRIFIHDCNKEVNLKIFANGRFQLSGIKDLVQAEYSIKIFLDYIIGISGTVVIPVINVNGVLYDKLEYEEFIHSKHTRFTSIKLYGEKSPGIYKIIGERKGEDFIINKYKVDLFGGFFIESKHTDHVKKIFDKNGEYIGDCTYLLKRKRKNLILHKCTYKQIDDLKYEIYDKYQNLLGIQSFVLFKESTARNEELCNINIVYNSIENNKIYELIKSGEFYKDLSGKLNLRITNINCNFTLNISGEVLHRENIHRLLTEKYDVVSYFKPDSKYQAINIKLYYDENMNIVSNKHPYKYRFTSLIFQTGKIIISGCTTKSQIFEVKKFLVNFFNTNYGDVVIKKNKNIIIKEEELSIFDIL